MSNLRSVSKKGQLNQALAVLNKIGQTLIATQNLSVVLKKIAQNAKDVLQADIVDLYEYNQKRNEFVLPPILIGKRWHRHVPKVKIYEDDVVVKVVKAGTPKYFPDAQNTAQLTRKFAVLRDDAPDNRFVVREGVVSSVSIPLLAGKETVGVMFVNYRVQQAFDDEQRNLVESFSNLAAIAIYNARLYKAEHDRRQLSDFQTQALDRLSRLSQRLVSIREEHENVSELLTEVAQSAKEVLRADIIELYEYSYSKRSYELPQISVGERIGPFVPKQGIYADDAVLQLIDRDEPSYIENSQVDDSIASDYTFVRADMPAERFAIRENIQSTAAIPLKAGDEPVGLMFANYRTKQEFTAEQKELIELFANQAAIAIYNARLYRAERDRRQALARLSQLSQRLVSIGEEHGNVRDLLNEIAQSAKEVLRSDIIELYEYLHSKRSYELPQISVGERIGPLVSKQEIYEDDSVLQLIDRDQPSYIENSQVDDSIGSDYKIARTDVPVERFAIREKIQSTAAIPLKAGDEPVGLMFANYRTKQKFTVEQKELIELFANQAAIAIQNVRLYKQLNRKVEDLNVLSKIGQQLTANMRLQEKEILELVHQKAGELMDADNMYIALYDEKADTIEFDLAFKDGKPISIQTRKIDDAHRGRTEEIIRTKQPIFIPTREESIKWYQRPGHAEFIGNPLASWIGVPMVLMQKVIGVIAMYHLTKDNVYSEDDLNILQSMADQAAIAIQNARLYYGLDELVRERTKQKDDINRRLEILINFGQTLTSGIRLKEGEILNLIHKQASELMDTQNMYVALYDEKTDAIKFGLAFQNGKPISIEPRKIDDTQRGRTEEIIRTKEPIFLPTKKESEDWYNKPGRQEFIGSALPSWIGVPIISEDKVLGVIATYHPTKDNVYNQDDLKILHGIADQAAIAIDNARLYYEVNADLITKTSELERLNSEKDEELQASRKKISQAEQMIVINSFTMDILHRVPNLVGTIPLRADTIIRKFKEKGAQVDVEQAIKQMEGIKKDAETLLVSVKTWNPIEEALKQIPEDVGLLLNSALRFALIPEKIDIETSFEENMPCVLCNPKELFESFHCIIENGFQAMPNGGKLSVKALSILEHGRPWVQVIITDSGHGIQPENLSKIFELGFTTKVSGFGYGLWRARAVVEKVGGVISVESVVNQGTTFFIKLPGQEGEICHD